jgi:hypothetical protein
LRLTRTLRRGESLIVATLVALAERWRQTGEVSDHLRVVRAVEPLARVVAAEARDVQGAKVPHDRLAPVDDDHAVVELIADQRSPVREPHCARRERIRIARQAFVRHVLPHHVITRINLDDPVVVRVRDQRVSIRQSAGEGDAAHSAVRRVRRQDLVVSIHLDRAVVVLVGDQHVAVGEQLSAVRVLELIGVAARQPGGAVLPDDLLAAPLDLDHALIPLIGDEHVAVGEIGVLDWRAQLVATGSSDAELAVLPDDLARAVDEEHAIIGAPARTGGLGARRRAGACHQRQVSHTLRVVHADDRSRGNIVRPAPKVPENVAGAIDLDHPVVELISDEKSLLGAVASPVLTIGLHPAAGGGDGAPRRGAVARAASEQCGGGHAECARDASREEMRVARGRVDRECRHGRLLRRGRTSRTEVREQTGSYARHTSGGAGIRREYRKTVWAT